MEGAQEIRKERAFQRANQTLKKEENARIIESLILDKFKDLEITNIVVWAADGFFMIDDDITDIPYDTYSETIVYNDFYNEVGYSAEFFQMTEGQKGLRITVMDWWNEPKLLSDFV